MEAQCSFLAGEYLAILQAKVPWSQEDMKERSILETLLDPALYVFLRGWF